MRTSAAESPPTRPGSFDTWWRTLGTMLLTLLVAVPLLLVVIAGPPLLASYLVVLWLGNGAVAIAATVLVTILWLSTIIYWALRLP